MCRANGKLWADFWRTDRCTQYLEALSSVMGFPITGHDGLVQARQGGTHQGTWVHPDVATELARWISPAFSVFVNRWFREAVDSQLSAQSTASTPSSRLDPVEATERTVAVIRNLADLFKEMGGLDDRDQLLFKDIARNQLLRLTGGDVPALPTDEELTLSDAWLEVFGAVLPRSKYKAAGVLIANAYRDEFGKEPATRQQFVDGAPRKVKSYRRHWLVETLQRFHSQLQES